MCIIVQGMLYNNMIIYIGVLYIIFCINLFKKYILKHL